MLYRIGVYEVHIQWVEIEAEDADNAISRVENGEGENKECYYNFTNESDIWIVLDPEGRGLREGIL
jgi:hypothetical protein